MELIIVFSIVLEGAARGPFSPLLLCLDQEVLSRCLLKLVEDGSLKLIQSSKGTFSPSHVMYGDDIFVLYKGSIFNINNLIHLFTRYSTASS